MSKSRLEDVRLKLKPGDFVQTVVQSVGVNGARANPEPWRNVDTLEVVKTVGSISLNPGKQIYATVRKVIDKTAKLELYLCGRNWPSD